MGGINHPHGRTCPHSLVCKTTSIQADPSSSGFFYQHVLFDAWNHLRSTSTECTAMPWLWPLLVLARCGLAWLGCPGYSTKCRWVIGVIGAGPKADQESAAFRSFRNGVYQEKEAVSSAVLCLICAWFVADSVRTWRAGWVKKYYPTKWMVLDPKTRKLT